MVFISGKKMGENPQRASIRGADVFGASLSLLLE
jgi:hypothetical protein